jgi:hypothetical protein
MKVILTLGLFMVLAACVASRSADVGATVTPVEIWIGGDDGLTLRLADSVEDELRGSARFSYGKTGAVPGALRVIIPTHVDWRKVGEQTRVTYRLELERGGHRNTASGGSCWESELEICAQQVVRTVTAQLR